VTQKKDIKRQKERLEALKKEAEHEKTRAKEAARERVLADFEKGQLGLAAVAAVTTPGTEVPGSKVHLFCFYRQLITCFCQGVGSSVNSRLILRQQKRWYKKLRRQLYDRSSVNRLLPCAASCRTSGCLH
jgi:hypothetical protein